MTPKRIKKLEEMFKQQKAYSDGRLGVRFDVSLNHHQVIRFNMPDVRYEGGFREITVRHPKWKSRRYASHLMPAGRQRRRQLAFHEIFENEERAKATRGSSLLKDRLR